MLGRTFLVIAVGIALAVAAVGSAATRPVTRLAGYQVTPPANSTATAETTFVLPAVSCTDPDALQVVVAGARLEAQGGDTAAGVATTCSGTSASYHPFTQANGAAVTGSVNAVPGDTIVVSVSEGPGGASATVSGTGWSQASTSTGGSASTAGVGYFAANCGIVTCAPVPPVPDTTFTGSKLDGAPLTLGTTATLSDLTDSKGSVQIAAGPANRTSGRFVTTWRRSCMPPVSHGLC